MRTVEKVARAIYELDASNRGCAVDWSEFEWTPNMRKAFFPMARAALQALREPSEGMVEAIQTEVDIFPEDQPRPSPNYVQFISRDEAVAIWHAGIDAALSEDSTPMKAYIKYGGKDVVVTPGNADRVIEMGEDIYDWKPGKPIKLSYPDLLDRFLQLTKEGGPINMVLFTSGAVDITIAKPESRTVKGSTFEEAVRMALARP